MTVITDRKAFDKAATPILATDARRLPKLLEKLTATQRRWVEASDFEGRAHTFCTVPGAKGEIDLVVTGVRDARRSVGARAPAAQARAGALLPGQGAGDGRRGQGRVRRGRSGATSSRATRRRAASPRDLQLDPSAKVAEALGLAEAVKLVRDLVNTPAEDMGPEAAFRHRARAGGALRRGVRRVGGRRTARAELPRDPRRGPRGRARAAPARAQLGQPEAPAPRHRRQGRVLRHRRPRHQGRRGHAPHEEGHGRRRARHRAGAPRDAAEASVPAAAPRAGRRERDQRQRLSPGRRGAHARGATRSRSATPTPRAASSCATRSPMRSRTSPGS